MQIVSWAWNVKACFLGKVRNIFQTVICWNFYPACSALIRLWGYCLFIYFIMGLTLRLHTLLSPYIGDQVFGRAVFFVFFFWGGGGGGLWDKQIFIFALISPRIHQLVSHTRSLPVLVSWNLVQCTSYKNIHSFEDSSNLLILRRLQFITLCMLEKFQQATNWSDFPPRK